MRLCCSKGIYSTTGVHGGAISGLEAEGAVRSGLCPLYMVYFFTKLIIYYNKLVLPLRPSTKKPALGNGLISCLQARRGGRWARLLQPAAHRSFLPLYQPPSPAIPTRYGHRAAPVAAAAERPLAAGCQSTGNLQPLQQRSRKEALLAVCCVQQLSSTCATARSYKQTRPPAKRLRGCAQQRRKNLVASC